MRIYILEDDPLLALDLVEIVEGCGHSVLECFVSLADMADRLDELPDFALLDIDLPDGKSFGIAAALDARGIPFAFVSGSRQGDLPEHLRHARFVAKPYSPVAIRNALRSEQRVAC